MRWPGFIGNFDTSQSPIADCEQTINWYREPLPQYGKNEAALYPTPGFESVVTVADVGTRAAVEVNGRTFCVVATTLYEMDDTFTMTSRGTVTQDNNPATITANGVAGGQLFITSGTNGYCYTLATNVLTQVLTGDATMGGMLDGYFIAFNVATSRIRLSDLNDGLTWDPTQFATRSTSPDPWNSMVVVQQPAGIWLIGQKTGEVWGDFGTFPFPLGLIPGATFRYGTPSTFSVGVSGDRVSWLSQSPDGAGIVVSARGYTPEPISTPPIETRISSFMRDSIITDCEILTYQDQGHIFCVFTFPSANATLVYDQSTNVWHQRGYWNSTLDRFDYWRPRVHVYSFGTHLVGERGTGTISEMDVSFGSEADGKAIRRLRRSPGISQEQRQLNYRRLQLYLETGLGLVSGQGSNPIIMLRVSDDGGKTWNPERTASAGAIGQYSVRPIWTRLGVSRDRVIEITCTDPIPWRLIDAYINNDGALQGAA